MPLPLRNVSVGGNPFTDFSGGGYFYLDQHDRAVLPTNDRHVLVVSITDGPGFKVDADYDLSGRIPAGEGIVSVRRPQPVMAPNPPQHPRRPVLSDTYRLSGPLGDGAEPSRMNTPPRECGSITFDSAGRIVTVCVGLDRPVLALLDPHTLQALAALPLPPRNSSGNAFTDFSGGGYFYLDNHDRAVVPTADRHILVVSITGGPAFQVVADYDLSSHIPQGEGIVSTLPDWNGRLWFVTRRGIVGTIDRGTGAVETRQLSGEGISNSFAVDETGGVYIVSDRALYRFDAIVNGRPDGELAGRLSELGHSQARPERRRARAQRRR